MPDGPRLPHETEGESMTPALDLEAMTTAEKLRLLEAVWQNLTRGPEEVPSPDWHAEVLEERDRRLKTGESQLSDWSEAKKRIRESLGGSSRSRTEPSGI